MEWDEVSVVEEEINDLVKYFSRIRFTDFSISVKSTSLAAIKVSGKDNMRLNDCLWPGTISQMLDKTGAKIENTQCSIIQINVL